MKKLRRRKAQGGFSLVESMISALVLGIGAAASATIFTSGVEGTQWTRERNESTLIALQRLEVLGTQGLAQIPTQCVGTVGCRLATKEMQPPVTCTIMLDETNASPSAALTQGRFRVDTIVRPHTDIGRQLGAQIVTVSVCWRDVDQTVHQTQLERLFVPNL